MSDDITLIEVIYITSVFGVVFLDNIRYGRKLTKRCDDTGVYPMDRSAVIDLGQCKHMVVGFFFILGMLKLGNYMGRVR